MNDHNECQGSCDTHRGLVKLVNIKNPDNKYDWGHWCYCEKAIAEDRKIGFIVTEIEESCSII